MITGWILIGLWVLLAFVMAAIPSHDNHWRRAYFLMCVGFPIVVWVFWNDGIWMGMIALTVGAIVLRWPVYFLWQWVKGRLGRADG